MNTKQVQIEWFDIETSESIGIFPTDISRDDPPCPKCGKPCEYWEGQIGDTPWGEDVYGWSFDCYHCKVHSDVKEL